MDTKTIRINPDEVLASMTRSWQEHGSAIGGEAVMKTCILNLLTFSPTAELSFSGR